MYSVHFAIAVYLQSWFPSLILSVKCIFPSIGPNLSLRLSSQVWLVSISFIDTFEETILKFYKSSKFDIIQHLPVDYLQLSTIVFAESNVCSETSNVRGSVMLKKCFTRPIKVFWSQRGASILNLAILAIVHCKGSREETTSYKSTL